MPCYRARREEEDASSGPAEAEVALRQSSPALQRALVDEVLLQRNRSKVADLGDRLDTRDQGRLQRALDHSEVRRMVSEVSLQKKKKESLFNHQPNYPEPLLVSKHHNVCHCRLLQCTSV